MRGIIHKGGNPMNRLAGVLAGATLVASVPLAHSADSFSDTETHVVRGLMERQSTMERFSKLALEKGSTDLVKTFAKLDIAEHEKLRTELGTLAGSIGITGAGIGGAGGPPPGGAPPGGGAPGAGGPPTGAAPGGAGGPPGGAAAPGRVAPGGAGGPPGGAGGPPGGGGGGPSSYANRYLEQLNGLSGAAFDEMYLLRMLQYHEDLERTLNGEIRSGVNAQLIAWSKANVETYEKHAQLLQRMLYGETKSIPATGPLGAGGPGGPGGAPGGAPAQR